MSALSVTSNHVAHAVDELRARTPIVHCLTNAVAAGFTANAVLAAGATPAMTDSAQEAGELAATVGGVLVNLGMVNEVTAAGMRAAISAAGVAGTPWVLDPVAVGALAWRRELSGELLAIASPSVIRGNPSEVVALHGGPGGRGVDATSHPEDAADAARALAQQYQTTVAVSGQEDLLTDGDRVVRVANGSPLLTRVTGVGCALGALVAGMLAVTGDRLLAATAATALLTVAADAAAAHSPGPGSFAVALLDELDATNADRIRLHAKLS